jgi:anti-sigma-K factor RskA
VDADGAWTSASRYQDEGDPVTHAEMEELYELYALGVLEPSLADEIDQHLATDCKVCSARVDEAVNTTAGISTLAGTQPPPVHVRERLLASTGAKVVRPKRWNYALAVLAAACIALAILLGVQTWRLRSAGSVVRYRVALDSALKDAEVAKGTARFAQAEMEGLRNQLRAADNERTRLQAALSSSRAEAVNANSKLGRATEELRRALSERSLLKAATDIVGLPQTQTIAFGNEAQGPRGRVLLNRNRGFAFFASNLPSVASDRTLELWIVPPTGAPRPAGLLRADSAGTVLQVSDTALSNSEVKAFAVSVEPSGGSAAPTTQPFLIVPVS